MEQSQSPNVINPTIEMFELDLQELDKFIKDTTRPNLKRQFEEYRKNILSLLNEEKRKLEKAKIVDQEKSSTVQEVTKSKIDFISVTKYALDSGDKFVK
jgi:hypothetical protein